MESSGSGQSSNSDEASSSPSSADEVFAQNVSDIVILNGMLQYYVEKGVYPVDFDVSILDYATGKKPLPIDKENCLFDFVNNWLRIPVEALEIGLRIADLHCKYMNSWTVEDRNPRFSNSPVDQKLFRASHMIWGGHNFLAYSTRYSGEEMNTSGGGDLRESFGALRIKKPFENLDEGPDHESKKRKMTESGGNADKDVGDIEILKALLVYYYYQKKAYPTYDLDGLHDFVNNGLPNHVNPLAIGKRILDMHSKYLNSLKNEDGKAGSSSSPDEQKIFWLSKMLWGYTFVDGDDLSGSTTGEESKSSGGGNQENVEKHDKDGSPKS